MEPSLSQSQKMSWSIPIAIIVGFGMIALAIFFTGGKKDAPGATENNPADTTATANSGLRPVDDTDYISGNPNAPILLVEYSDYDCPFCKQFHETLDQIIDEYGVTGRIAWVYRQFPIAQLHPNSPKISEAALCVGDIGGNDAFWKFTNLIFQQRDITEPTNVTLLPEYAESAGISREAYIECMDSGRMEAAVTASIEDGFNAGARGTPYTVLIAGNQQAVIDGARSYDTVKGIVKNLIDQLDGNFNPTADEVPEASAAVHQ
ncbi:MAG: thioredoxin domain-containing protein [Patescibacteria group bacterium]